MLVELGVVEQRYRAVLEVLEEGVPVTTLTSVPSARCTRPITSICHSCIARLRSQRR